MTKVSYNIVHKGRVVKNVVGYQEAVSICEQLGSGWRFKPVYTEYNVNDTPEYLKQCKEHADKVAEKRKEKVATA